MGNSDSDGMEILNRVLVLCVLGSTQGFLQSKQILLEGNGYTGVTVAISSQLSPSEIQIQKIKVSNYARVQEKYNA